MKKLVATMLLFVGVLSLCVLVAGEALLKLGGWKQEPTADRKSVV